MQMHLRPWYACVRGTKRKGCSVQRDVADSNVPSIANSAAVLLGASEALQPEYISFHHMLELCP